MFKDLLDRFSRKPAAADSTAERLAVELARPPSEHDIDRLVPLILPSALLRPYWPGPIEALGDLPFALTWAIAGDGNSFVYVTRTIEAHWDAAGIDWRARAMENLQRIARKDRASHEKNDEFGLPFVQVLLNEDAIGPSRLLLPGFFEDTFGEDYLVAIPEQTCAVVYRTDLTEEETALVDTLINECFEGGTEPMTRERFDPRRFWAV